MQLLFSLDENITKSIFLLFPHNQFFDSFFSFFSFYGGSIFIWLVVIIFIVFIEEIQHPGVQKTDRIFVLCSFFSFGLTSFLSDFVLKKFFGRFRPQISILYDLGNTICPTNFSFPSTHAATAFAVATIISYFDKKRKWFYYSIAFLISLSRIYLGCHYFFDVLAGAIFGAFISKIIIKLSSQLHKT